MKNQPITLDREPEPGDAVTISGPALESLLSWSPRPGMAVTVTGPGGASFRARIMALQKDRAELFVFEKMSGPAESGIEIFLLQALPEKERMELIIEKAVELGADLIVPWKAEKGVSLAEREAGQPKAHRWAERAKKAAIQCRRAKIPSIAPFCDLDAAMEYALGAELKIVLFEKTDKPMKEIIAQAKSPASVALLVGPEGGLTENEVSRAKAAGFLPASLGSRILRTETAAIVAVALIQYALGDLGA